MAEGDISMDALSVFFFSNLLSKKKNELGLGCVNVWGHISLKKNVKVMECTVLHYFASLLLNNLRLNNCKQVVDS